MVTEEYSIAYSEVLEILKHVSKEDYDKINKKDIEFYEKNKKEDYDFTYNVNEKLDEQGVSKIAKVIIATIYRDYWASDEERKQILEMQDNIRKKLKNEMQIEFDPNTMFKKKEKKDKKKEISEVPVLKEKSAFSKFINKIKTIFHIK